ncbi:MAG: acetyl-CoA carboxylase biotin carboxyl carrier protein [Planctomycetota bacterium]
MKPEKKMGNERENETAVFDVNRIRQLIELMNEHELNEIDLRHDERRSRLRRGELQNFVGVPTMMPAQAAHSAPAQPAAAVAAPAAAPDPGAKSAPAAEEAGVFIKSPMVGTFYSRPKPTAAPYVKVGDVIQPDTVVCLVEAMKTFNELPAGIAGKVVAVLVKDEEPIDVNRPLFKVVPA